MTSLRTAAAKYASLGYAIIPLHWVKPDGSCSCNRIDCESVGKHPLGEHGARDPMTNPELVTAQWDKYPNANIGIVAGASRLCIIDLDSQNAEDHFIDQADIDTIVAINTAPISKTGKGRHIVFADPSGDYGPSVGKDTNLGIDIRAGVSYIVAPPSTHQNGTTYEWLQNAPPSQAPLVTPWLHEYITRRTRNKPEVILDDGVEIPQGARNQTLFELGYSMRHKGFTQEAIEAALLTMNATKTEQPLSQSEVSSIARQAASYDPKDVPLLMPIVTLDELVEAKRETGTQRYTFLNEQQISELPPVDYIIDKLVPRGGYGITYGRRGSYKTFDTLDLALSLSTGTPYHGLDTHPRSGIIAYIMSEGSASLNKRVNAWKQAHAIDDIPGFYALPTSVPLPDAQARADLAIAIDTLPDTPDLIVIDTLARSIPGLDENKSQDMTTFIGIIDELRARYTGCAIMAVHHAGWNATHERGSTVVGDAADWIMAINKNADTEKVTCKVEKVKDEEMPPPYICTFLPIAKTGSGVLVQDTNVPADEDLELVFSHYYSLSPEERTQGIPFTRLVDESGSKKRAQRIRNIANFEAELAARNLRLATRGSTNAYYLESVSSIPEMAS